MSSSHVPRPGRAEQQGSHELQSVSTLPAIVPAQQSDPPSGRRQVNFTSSRGDDDDTGSVVVHRDNHNETTGLAGGGGGETSHNNQHHRFPSHHEQEPDRPPPQRSSKRGHHRRRSSVEVNPAFFISSGSNLKLPKTSPRRSSASTSRFGSSPRSTASEPSSRAVTPREGSHHTGAGAAAAAGGGGRGTPPLSSDDVNSEGNGHGPRSNNNSNSDGYNSGEDGEYHNASYGNGDDEDDDDDEDDNDDDDDDDDDYGIDQDSTDTPRYNGGQFSAFLGIFIKSHKLLVFIIILSLILVVENFLQQMLSGTSQTWQWWLAIAASSWCFLNVALKVVFWLVEKHILIPAGLLFYSQGILTPTLYACWSLLSSILLEVAWPWRYPPYWLVQSFWLFFVVSVCCFFRVVLVKRMAMAVLKDNFFVEIKSVLAEVAVLKAMRRHLASRDSSSRIGTSRGSGRGRLLAKAKAARDESAAASTPYRSLSQTAMLGSVAHGATSGADPAVPGVEKRRRKGGILGCCNMSTREHFRRFNDIINEVQEGTLRPMSHEELDYKKQNVTIKVWGNLQYTTGGSKRIEKEDLGTFFENANSQNHAWKVINPRNYPYVTKRDIRIRVGEIYDNRNYLANQLSGRQNIINVIETFLSGIFWTIMFCFALLWYGINFFELIAPIASLLLAFSFAFGNSLKNIFDSFVLVVFISPYDVGDKISFHYKEMHSAPTMVVHEITLLETKFMTTDGKNVIVPNYLVYQYEVKNHKRSLRATFDFEFDISATTTPEQFRRIDEASKMFIKESPDQFVYDGYKVYVATVANSNKYKLTCWLETQSSWQDWDGWTDAKTRFFLFMEQTLDELGVYYELPLQPVAIRSGQAEQANVF